MEKHWNQLLFEALAVAYGSWTPFGTLVSYVKADYLGGMGTADEVRETTLKLCADLIENKWIDVLDMEQEPRGDVLQLPDKEMMALIDERWRRIGYAYPETFDVIWYTNTEEGYLAFQRLSSELMDETKPSRRRKRHTAQYHILIEETDENKTGANSGTQAFSEKPFPEFAPTLEFGERCRSRPTDLGQRGTFQLEAGCLLTDVLSFSFNPCKNLLVSDRMAQLLQGFRISDCTFLPVDVVAHGRTYPYHMLLIHSDKTWWIDFDATVFHSQHTFSKKREVLKLSSMEDYHQWRKANDSLVRVVARNGYVLKGDINQFDLFRIGYFDVNVYVSERLKMAIVEANITGIHFQTAEYF